MGSPAVVVPMVATLFLALAHALDPAAQCPTSTRPALTESTGPHHLVGGVKRIFHHHISKMGGTTMCRLAHANECAEPYCRRSYIMSRL